MNPGPGRRPGQGRLVPLRLPPRPPVGVDDTIDEADQPRDEATAQALPGWDELRHDRRSTSSPVLDPYFDAGPEDPRSPRNVDLDGRLLALEQALPSAAANARYVRWGVRFGGGLLGLGTAILVWALASARANGDAAATTREREAERVRIREAVQLLLERDARRQGQLDSLLDALRSRFPIGAVPLLGPPTDPSPQVTP